jgi:creatinine amidohydrolase
MFLADMTSPAVNALDRNIPVVIPIAALEQHGQHLPVFTDSLLLGEVVRRAALTPNALFVPLQWLGNSHHHIDYPGTVSAPPRLYLDLLRELAENFLAHGFKRLFFLNGHGGNIIPAKQAIFELRQKYRERDDLLLLSASYWELAQPHQEKDGYHQTTMGHACEWETSMILWLKPDLVVGDAKSLETVLNSYGFDPAYRGWITNERTPTGHIGSPQFATKEKGEHLFASFSAGVVRFIEKMQSWGGRGWD